MYHEQWPPADDITNTQFLNWWISAGVRCVYSPAIIHFHLITKLGVRYKCSFSSKVFQSGIYSKNIRLFVFPCICYVNQRFDEKIFYHNFIIIHFHIKQQFGRHSKTHAKATKSSSNCYGFCHRKWASMSVFTNLLIFSPQWDIIVFNQSVWE